LNLSEQEKEEFVVATIKIGGWKFIPIKDESG